MRFFFQKEGYVYRLTRYRKKSGIKHKMVYKEQRILRGIRFWLQIGEPKDEWGSINDNLGQGIDRRSNVKSELFNSINFPLRCLLC